MVWKDTKELGVARAKSNNGSVYVVARYRSAGNILSAFNGNVLPKVRVRLVNERDSTAHDFMKRH